jgi:hypothetical protein
VTTRPGRRHTPLGYGKANPSDGLIGLPSNSNRYLTSYARTISVRPDRITGMALSPRTTAVVFVNGRLAYNDNLLAALEPDLGALTARTPRRRHRAKFRAGQLGDARGGTNVVAVEFHKYAQPDVPRLRRGAASLGLTS